MNPGLNPFPLSRSDGRGAIPGTRWPRSASRTRGGMRPVRLPFEGSGVDGRRGGHPMTEAEWLSSADPRAMLGSLRDGVRLSDRKARLFGAATARRLWPLLTDGRSRKAVEAAERYAD